MMDKKIISSPHIRNNSVNKNFTPVRSSIIRGASMNHHSMPHHTLNQNSSITQAKVPPKPLTYFIGKGNNEDIVRRVMSVRSIWNQSDDSTSAFINLKWQQDQKGFRYQRLVQNGQYKAVVNHFEFHENLSNKQFLFRNLQKYCNKSDYDIWKIVPPTFILNSREECCMQSLKLFVDYYSKHFPKTLKQRRGTSEVQKQIYRQRRNLRSFFFCSNLKKVLPKNPPLGAVYINKDEGDYLWIVKPPFLNRGRGIYVFSRLPDLTKFVTENINGYIQKKLGNTETQDKKKLPVVDYIRKNFEAAKQAALLKQVQGARLAQDFRDKAYYEQENQQVFDGNQFIRIIPSGPSIIKTDCFLIQKYLQNPMLIHSRKFDIRMWVLMSQNMKAYVFPEGYVRLSSFQYSCKQSKQSSFIHLTNNAVQKFSQDYGKLAEGNQMSFGQLKAIMAQNNLCFQNFIEKTYEHIKISINSSVHKLNSLNRKHSFQIFGYDFMIDQGGYPWLIQVNTNPCIEQSSTLLKHLIPRMIDDAFKLTIDTMFYGSVSTGNFPVDGYGKENMWVSLPID